MEIEGNSQEGFRFRSEPEELLHELKQKVKGTQPSRIQEAPVYKVEPWKLQGVDNAHYCFTKREKKGARISREAGEGRWDPKGRKKPIKNPFRNETIGFETYLIYKVKKASTDNKREDIHWKMLEYSLPDQYSSAEKDWVVCKITRSKGGSSSSTDTNEAASTSIAGNQLNEEYSTDQGYLDGPIRSPDNMYPF